MEPVTEIWKDVPGYEGLYQVSNLGRVKSLEKVRYMPNGFTKRIYSEKILKVGYTKGYHYVVLCKDGSTKNKTVHRLVASVFIFNFNNLPQVNHINGVKTDNRLENLEWVTASQNQVHSIEVLGNKILSGAANHLAKSVEQYSLDGRLVNLFGSGNEAAIFTKIKQSQINGCCNNLPNYKTAGGFIWQYADTDKKEEAA